MRSVETETIPIFVHRKQMESVHVDHVSVKMDSWERFVNVMKIFAKDLHLQTFVRDMGNVSDVMVVLATRDGHRISVTVI